MSLHTTPRQNGIVSRRSPAAAPASSAALVLSYSRHEAAFDLESVLLHLTPHDAFVTCRLFKENIKAGDHGEESSSIMR